LAWAAILAGKTQAATKRMAKIEAIRRILMYLIEKLRATSVPQRKSVRETFVKRGRIGKLLRKLKFAQPTLGHTRLNAQLVLVTDAKIIPLNKDFSTPIWLP